MTATRRPFFLRLLLVALLAFGLLATGLAHRAPSASDEAQAVYALAGGDLADLCGTAGQPGHDDCPACHLTGTDDLPASAALSRPAELALTLAFTAPRENHAVRAVLDPSHGTRAPPLA